MSIVLEYTTYPFPLVANTFLRVRRALEGPAQGNERRVGISLADAGLCPHFGALSIDYPRHETAIVEAKPHAGMVGAFLTRACYVGGILQ